MIKTILIAIIAVVALLLVYATTRPDSFRLERSTSIKAPPEKAFALINDFHQWAVWSPWEHMDADLKRSYSGPASGVGSVYTWEGKKTGSGRMEILESSAPSKIRIKLDFMKPFEAHNIAEFTLASKGDVTEVTWAMFGPSPYAAKVMGLFFNMDKVVGKDFETGLANLKVAAEH